MNSIIEELLNQNNLIEALAEIKILSQNSFSDPEKKQDQGFDKLQESKSNGKQETGITVYNENISITGTKYCTTDTNRDEALFSSHPDYATAARNIVARRYIPIQRTMYDTFIYLFIFKTRSSTVVKGDENSSISEFDEYKNGDYFVTSLDDTRIVHTLVGKNHEAGVPFAELLNKLCEVLDKIFTKRDSKVGIVLEIDESNPSIKYSRLPFTFLLMIVASKMAEYSSSAEYPSVYFLLKSEIFLELFRQELDPYQTMGLYLLGDSTISSTMVDNLAERCLTRHPDYIKLLRTTLSIIDEVNIPILLRGESGVGKSYLAKIIHELSDRNKGPFVDINCGSLTSEKLDQKLWGWKRGAFTGAREDYDGIIKRADKGTLFLDEIDNAPFDVKTGLLTFIETKKYEVLGGKKAESANVRLIFGSNKDLKSLVKKGQFPYDLYTRIARRIVTIPPLRSRPDDIDLIINHLLTQLNMKKESAVSMDSEARKLLKSYSWPGNLRELESTIINCFHEAESNYKKVITKEIVEKFPFEHMMSVKEEDFENLLELLKSFLSNWNEDSGNFLKEIIKPILAKLYFEDCFNHLDKEQKWMRASKILGLSGNQHNKSTLEKERQKFSQVKDKLGLN